MIDLTIVIPTYNRRELLKTAIESLRNQTHPSDRYEIVIVSDGSTDGTDEMYATPLGNPLTRLVRQEKQGFGLAAARNLGLQTARGELVMFLDDDMFADERLVEMHVEAHTKFNEHVAICGRVRPAPNLPATPFCKIVIRDICDVYDEHVEATHFIPFQRALSWQTSFKRSELERLGGYETSFRQYGWEDIEFSYRAAQQGLNFYYEPRAVSFHQDQRNTLATHGQRLRDSSRVAPIFFARHPELRNVISMYDNMEGIDWRSDAPRKIVKKGVRRLLATRPLMTTLEVVTPMVERMLTSPALLRRWYYGLLGSYILIGYREGLASLAADSVSHTHRSQSNGKSLAARLSNRPRIEDDAATTNAGVFSREQHEQHDL